MRKQKSLYLDPKEPAPKSSYLKFILNRHSKSSNDNRQISNKTIQEESPKVSVMDKIQQIEGKKQISKSTSFYASPKTKVTTEEKKFEKEMIQQIKDIDKAIELIEKNESTVTSRKEHFELKILQKNQQKLYDDYKAYEGSYLRLKYKEIEEKYIETEKNRRMLEEKNKKLKEELDKYVKYQKLNLKLKQYEIEMENAKENEERLLKENASLKDRFESNYNLVQDMFEEKEILIRQKNEIHSQFEDLKKKYIDLDKQIQIKNEEIILKDENIEQIKIESNNNLISLKEENEKLKEELSKKNELYIEMRLKIEENEKQSIQREKEREEFEKLNNLKELYELVKKERDFYEGKLNQILNLSFEIEKQVQMKRDDDNVNEEMKRIDSFKSPRMDSIKMMDSSTIDTTSKSKLKTSFILGESIETLDSNITPIQSTITFEELIEDKDKVLIFKKFADSEYSGEYVQFLFDVYNFKEESKLIHVSEDIFKNWIDSISDEYFTSNAKSPLNLSQNCLNETVKKIKCYDPNAFDLALVEITYIVKEIYTRFLQSSIWRDYELNEKYSTNFDVQSKKKKSSFEFYPKKNIPSIFEYFEKISKIKRIKKIKHSSTTSLTSTSTGGGGGGGMNGQYHNTNLSSSLQDIQLINGSTGSISSTGSMNEMKETKELEEFDSNRLIEFIENENEEEFLKYVEMFSDEFEHFDLETRFSNKMTLLHFACSKNFLSICELLIKKGSNINSTDGQSRIPLHIAASHGYYDLCILLLGNGSKINVRDLYGHSPIMLALKSHHFHLISDLQLFGGDINFKRDNGMCILHEVLQTSDEEILDFLVNIKTLKYNQKDEYGQTPLLKSAQQGKPNFIHKFMILKEVDSKIVDDSGKNIFHLLAKYSRNDVFDYFANSNYLKEYSQLFLKKDLIKGWTPLHVAVHSSNIETVRSIVEIMTRILFIDIHIKDNKGLTPYSLAVQKLQKLKGLQDSKDELIEGKKQKTEKIKEYLQSFEKKRKNSFQVFVESL